MISGRRWTRVTVTCQIKMVDVFDLPRAIEHKEAKKSVHIKTKAKLKLQLKM